MTSGRNRQHRPQAARRPSFRPATTARRIAVFRLADIDNRAGLHAARLNVADAQHLDGMAAPAQRDPGGGQDFSRAIRQAILLVPTSRAATIALRLCGNRPHFGREAAVETGHAAPAFLGLLVFDEILTRLCGVFRQADRSRDPASRISMAVISRDISCLSRSSEVRSVRACSTFRSGRRTSMPLVRRRFQRRSPTITAGANLAFWTCG